MVIRRSLKISLELGNTGKKEVLDNLWNEYRRAVSDFLDRLLAHEGLAEDFLKSYGSRLSYRYKQCAKRQAMKLFKTWCRKKGKKSRPRVRQASMTLDERFVEVQGSDNSFDFWIKLATLEKGNPILIPAKRYAYLNKYLTEWELVPGGRVVQQKDQWVLMLTFEKEKPEPKVGTVKAADLGYRKLAVTSAAEVIGEKLPELIEKADRKKPYSKGYDRAKAEIKRYVNRELKKLFNDNLAVLVTEELKRLKDGKRGKWSKAVNRKFGFWIYGHALRRVKELGEVGGVHCPQVRPAYTSQRCPLCGHQEKLNRQGEQFKCRRCGFEHDADYVGALNILSRFTGEPIVPQMIKPLECFSIL
jgi:transposase